MCNVVVATLADFLAYYCFTVLILVALVSTMESYVYFPVDPAHVVWPDAAPKAKHGMTILIGVVNDVNTKETTWAFSAELVASGWKQAAKRPGQVDVNNPLADVAVIKITGTVKMNPNGLANAGATYGEALTAAPSRKTNAELDILLAKYDKLDVEPVCQGLRVHAGDSDITLSGFPICKEGCEWSDVAGQEEKRSPYGKIIQKKKPSNFRLLRRNMKQERRHVVQLTRYCRADGPHHIVSDMAKRSPGTVKGMSGGPVTNGKGNIVGLISTEWGGLSETANLVSHIEVQKLLADASKYINLPAGGAYGETHACGCATCNPPAAPPQQQPQQQPQHGGETKG